MIPKNRAPGSIPFKDLSLHQVDTQLTNADLKKKARQILMVNQNKQQRFESQKSTQSSHTNSGNTKSSPRLPEVEKNSL